MLSEKKGRKISLMIIGAQKAGTTSLKNYLGQHPALATHPHKEFSFFFDASEYEKGFENACKRYFEQDHGDHLLIAKNAGLYVNEQGLSRLRDHNPDCSLVIILRNPVQRSYSSFLMETNYGSIREPFTIMEAVAQKADITDWRYEFLIGMSIYADHLNLVYRYFPKEQVRIVRYEDLDSRPVEVCRDIFHWMNVDESFVPETSIRHNATLVTRSHTYSRFIKRLLHNENPVKKIARRILPGKSDYKMGEILRNINKSEERYQSAPPGTIAFLHAFFKPHNDRLTKLTGIDFSSWNNVNSGNDGI
jgi:hypothetical protein